MPKEEQKIVYTLWCNVVKHYINMDNGLEESVCHMPLAFVSRKLRESGNTPEKKKRKKKRLSVYVYGCVCTMVLIGQGKGVRKFEPIYQTRRIHRLRLTDCFLCSWGIFGVLFFPVVCFFFFKSSWKLLLCFCSKKTDKHKPSTEAERFRISAPEKRWASTGWANGGQSHSIASRAIAKLPSVKPSLDWESIRSLSKQL